MSQNSYQLIVLAADVQLTWPSSFSGGSVVTDISDVEVISSGKTITMPDATLVPNGTQAIFNNISDTAFDLDAFDGEYTIETIDTGEIFSVYLFDNSTPAGEWRAIPYGGGASSITSFTAQSTDNSITITNGAITPPGGTINFQQPTSLFNFNAINTKGLVSVITNNSNTYATRTITGGSNITLTNGDGVSGNPIVNLSSTLTGLTSIGVGNLTLTGSTFSNNNTNGGITISSNGSGTVNINGVTISTSGNISGTFTNSLKAWCIFTDTLTEPSGNVIAIKNQANVASVTGSDGSYTITFTNALSTQYYGVLVTAGTVLQDGTSLPIVAHGFSVYSAQSTTTCQIAVVDASGEYVTQAPNGITVAIFSAT